MFELIFMFVLVGIIAYLRMRLIDKEVEITDLRIKNQFQAKTLDAIVKSRNPNHDRDEWVTATVIDETKMLLPAQEGLDERE